MFGSTSPRFLTLLLIALIASPLLASNSVIRFDLPPSVAAKPTGSEGRINNIVECQFRLSSLIASPDSPQIDQWLIVFQPRDSALAIVDYCPKTDAESDIEGPIEVKTSRESTASMGLSLDGSYGHAVRANIGADKGNKRTDSRQYALAAPQRVVTASGTINRGRGVYFKLLRSAKQILEGEKKFQLILQVPDHWRGSLIDVSIIAQSERRTLAGLDKQVKTMGHSNFVVAAYRDGDLEAAKISRQLADAEQAIRSLADHDETENCVRSLSGILTRVAVKLDLHSPKANNRWIWRLLAGDADPYLDREIGRLPMELRLAILNYCEIREDFDRLAQSPILQSSDRVAAHKRLKRGDTD